MKEGPAVSKGLTRLYRAACMHAAFASKSRAHRTSGSSTSGQPLTFASGELANWFTNWFGELAVRSVSEFALDGIPLVRCIGSVVRPWVPEPSH